MDPSGIGRMEERIGRIGSILLRMRLGSPTTPLLLPQAGFVTGFLGSVLPIVLG